MKVLVFTTVYPSSAHPGLGVFVRERMSRVARDCELVVVAPVPTFPLAGLVKKTYRQRPPYREVQDGVTVLHPSFYLIPGYCKFLDGLFLALSSLPCLWRLRRDFRFELIDAHFAYPDGFAAVLLGRIFRVPVVITLRGTINRLLFVPRIAPLVRYALRRADRVLSVSRYLLDLALTNTPGLDPGRCAVVPNGVDPAKFRRQDRALARQTLAAKLGLTPEQPVLVSVGGLVERKGHHRVLAALPEVRRHYPDVKLLIVGSGGVEGDMGPALREQARELGLEDAVVFAGQVAHGELAGYLSAADVFVLATRFEGWPNVFFEAMACGLPVVSTQVCGNAEIVTPGRNGLLVPFDDAPALAAALVEALGREWDRQAIMDFAVSRPWEQVAAEVLEQLRGVLRG